MTASLGLAALLTFPAWAVNTGEIRNGETELELLDVRRIWDRGVHNAFTDLVWHQGRWFCVFREAADHVVSPDGALRVITSVNGTDWESAALLKSNGRDLRDPKLTTMPDGRLMLSCAGALLTPGTYTHQSYVITSEDGFTWGEPLAVGDPNYWLWRVTWHGETCYGVGYSVGKPWGTRLYSSGDGTTYHTLVQNLYDKGSANETSIVFMPDETAYCLLRSDTSNGLLGKALPPYVDWEWHDVGRRIGGPHMLRLPDGRLVAAVRLYDGRLRTALCSVDGRPGVSTSG